MIIKLVLKKLSNTKIKGELIEVNGENKIKFESKTGRIYYRDPMTVSFDYPFRLYDDFFHLLNQTVELQIEYGQVIKIINNPKD